MPLHITDAAAADGQRKFPGRSEHLWHHQRVSGSLRRLRRQSAVLIIWVLVCAALFVYCFLDKQLDDVCGFIIVMWILQQPAFAVAREPASDPPQKLPRFESVACALSLGLVTGLYMFVLVAMLGSLVWGNDFMEMRPIHLGFLAGLVVWISMAIRFSTRLRNGPHPEQLRRGLYQLLAVASVSLVTAIVVESDAFFGAGDLSLADMFLLILPFLWTSPLWLLLPRRERTGAPRATVV